MMKAILDPSIYELTDREKVGNITIRRSMEIQHMKFMSNLFNFLIKYSNLDVKLYFTYKQYWNLCNPSDHPWNQYKYITNKNALISVFSMLNKLKPVIENIQVEEEYKPCDFMNELTDSISFAEYCKLLPFAYSVLDTFLFYGRLNNIGKTQVEYKYENNSILVTPIYDFNEDFNDSLRTLILLEPKYQRKPSLDNPLPNIEICEKYIKLKDADIFAGKDLISTCTKYATEVALRNNYFLDNHLVNINKGRTIFTHIKNKNIHLSIDKLHGNLEVYNAFGEHQDEYSYDNKPQHKQDKSGKHNINV